MDDSLSRGNTAVINKEETKIEPVILVGTFEIETNKENDVKLDANTENKECLTKHVVASYHECKATIKNKRPIQETEFEVPDAPGKIIAIKILGPLPRKPRGVIYVLMVMDLFSKYTKLFLIENRKLDLIIETLQIKYFGRNGIPNKILTDNDISFQTTMTRFRDRNRFFLANNVRQSGKQPDAKGDK